MKKIITSAILASYFLVTSCAGLISGSTQNVFLRTSNNEEVEVEVSSASGVQNVKIPASVNVRRANSPLTISVKEKGCIKESKTYSPQKYNVFLFADAIGGIFGLTGTTIDMSSGAAWAYENEIVVNVKDSCKK